MRRLFRRNRGAVMVLAAACITVLLLMAGLALDFGRIHLLRTHLQTAVDAASLAGALQAIPMVDVRVNRRVWVEETCQDPVSGEWYDCSHWETADPVVLSGTYRDLIDENGWRRGPHCERPYSCRSRTILREWLILPPSTEPVARDTFWLNARWPVSGSLGPEVRSLEIGVDQAATSVTATARLRAPTTFLRLAGYRYIEFTRSGSAVPVKR